MLVKVSESGRVAEKNIERSLEWILKHREKYDIRILNTPLGGDADLAADESWINMLAEECVKQGIVVVVQGFAFQ